MNIVSLEKGKVSISINGPITFNDNIYSNLVFIGRLLSLEELARVDSFSSESKEYNLVVEDNVFDLAVEGIVGFDDDILSNINRDKLEAGIISTVSLAIIAKSYFYYRNAEKILGLLSEEVEIVDSINAVVSRYTCTPYDEVRKLPINELMKRFAILQKTFPNEIRLQRNEE